MVSPNFTRDWISGKTDPWIGHVVPRLANVPNARWIELGSYQGRSALWTLENVLRGPGALIYCVDVFEPWPKSLPLWGDPESNYVKVFDEMVGCRPNVVKLAGRTADVLPILRGTAFHGAYVDACHDEDDVRRDVTLLWPLLAPGAVCVFDDYGWVESPGVKIVADQLVGEEKNNAVFLHQGFQAIVLKNLDT